MDFGHGQSFGEAQAQEHVKSSRTQGASVNSLFCAWKVLMNYNDRQEWRDTMIADRWRNDTNNNVRYFSNNVRDGIRTFEDDAIRAILDAPREGSSPQARDAQPAR